MKKSEFIVRTILVVLCGIAIGLQAGCENINTNFALVNTRSPVIKASGTNNVEATTGIQGGGTFTAKTPTE